MNWKKRTQVDQTADAPPRCGSSILPTIGWQTKRRNALRKSVAARIRDTWLTLGYPAFLSGSDNTVSQVCSRAALARVPTSLRNTVLETGTRAKAPRLHT